MRWDKSWFEIHTVVYLLFKKKKKKQFTHLQILETAERICMIWAREAILAHKVPPFISKGCWKEADMFSAVDVDYWRA